MTATAQPREPLLPCPFCGSALIEIAPVRDGVMALCATCGASACAAFHGLNNDTQERAIAAWNKRIASPAERPDPLCEDCPPVGYPTDKTRCAPCPRRPADPLAAWRADGASLIETLSREHRRCAVELGDDPDAQAHAETADNLDAIISALADTFERMAAQVRAARPETGLD